jgi:hypothetical protein
MACMRSKSGLEIISAVGNPGVANHALDCTRDHGTRVSLSNCTDYGPVIDGVLIPNDIIPAILGTSPMLPSAVPTVFGHTRDDAMLFVVGTDDGTAAGGGPDVAAIENYEMYVNAPLTTRAYLRGFPRAVAAALPRVLAAYPAVPGGGGGVARAPTRGSGARGGRAPAPAREIKLRT